MEPGIHPFIAGASVAIILLSGVGIATVTGYLPGPNAQKAERAVVVEVKEVDAKGQGAGTWLRIYKRYEVSVRLQDGSVKTVPSDAPPAWKSGDKVRVVNGRLEPV